MFYWLIELGITAGKQAHLIAYKRVIRVIEARISLKKESTDSTSWRAAGWSALPAKGPGLDYLFHQGYTAGPIIGSTCPQVIYLMPHELHQLLSSVATVLYSYFQVLASRVVIREFSPALMQFGATTYACCILRGDPILQFVAEFVIIRFAAAWTGL
jgi:hypothetical protein